MRSYRCAELPAGHLASLAGRHAVGPVEPIAGRTTFLDTFDRRLAREGLRLALDESDGGRRLSCLTRDGERAAPWSPSTPPAFAAELPSGRLRQAVAAAAGVRRLLPQAVVERRGSGIALHDARGKTIGRLVVEERRAWLASGAGSPLALPSRCVAYPWPGCEADTEAAAAEIARRGDLQPAPADELAEALAALGGSLASPVPPFVPDLSPMTAAPQATGEILARLLGIVEANLPGLRRDLDTEFVHDVRVALRRARSLLREMRSVLPAERARWLRNGLAWLADLSGGVRDDDTLLLALPDYAAALPEEHRDDVRPVVTALIEGRRDHLASLVAALESPSGMALLAAWRSLADDLAEVPGPPLHDLASRRVRKVGRRVARRAAKVTRKSPPPDLHRLRIEAKRLRYLLEFFRSLYEPDSVTAALRALRRLQGSLGELQDQAVHAERLETLLRDRPDWLPATLIAMGRLLAELDRRTARSRRGLDKRIRRFLRREPWRLPADVPAAGSD